MGKVTNFIKSIAAAAMVAVMVMSNAVPAKAAITEYDKIPWSDMLHWSDQQGNQVSADKLQYQITKQVYTVAGAKTVSQLLNTTPKETVGKLKSLSTTAALSTSYKQKKDKKGNITTTMTCYKVQIIAPFFSEAINADLDYTSETSEIEKSDLDGEDPWLVILNTPSEIAKNQTGVFKIALGAAYDGTEQTIEAGLKLKAKKYGLNVACVGAQYGDSKLSVADVDCDGGCQLENIVYRTGFVMQFTLHCTPQVDKKYR